ncbi:hypothetical protein FisN_5Hh185 [Fistulifera solaris]|uniref:CBM6 domain-containing protein n=1 Tax=Fistulifera solaris TaxID=1519565 RepID=A0A1Z5JS07_FISSO|nr:hypothetical protein FisN_5Hh185 [Fistulifera solaris]|eukprot:GAX16813.1 hypothetical protein FisN_5Hh185 [Fistulifera solaris]
MRTRAFVAHLGVLIAGAAIAAEAHQERSLRHRHVRRRLEQDFQVKLFAGEYVDMEGIVIENSTEGNKAIGWIDQGDWAAYNITLPSAGTYDLKLEVASPTGDGSLSVTDFVSNQEYAFFSDLPNTSDWQNWETVSVSVELPEGSSTLKLNFLSPGFNLLSLELSESVVVDENDESPSESFKHIYESGSLRIPADKFSSMEGIVVESSSEGGYSIGWLDAGDMVTYNVSLPLAGVYKLEMRIASPSGNGAFSITDSSNQEFALMTRLPQTNDWQSWQTISFEFTLPAGPSDLVVNVLRSGWNLLWLELSSTDEPSFEPQEDEFRLRLPADEFLSMQGIVVETLPDGGRYVAWLDPDDWMTYSITVPSNGTYRIDMQVSSPAGIGAFELSNLDTREVYGFENYFPATGGWQNWETVRLNATLPAGSLTMKVQVLDPGWNLLSIEIVGLMPGNNTDESPEGNNDDGVVEEDVRVRISASNYSSMEGIVTETSSEGSESIGSLDAGDSVNYEISLPTRGLYGAQMRVSNFTEDSAFVLSNTDNGEEYAFVNNTSTTEDVGNWENISFNTTLPSGFLPLQLKIVGPGWSLLWIEFNLLESHQNSTYYDQFQATISASNFSSMEGVELQEFPEGLQQIGLLEKGDWAAFNLSIPYEGTYKMILQVSSPSGEGSFEVVDMESETIYATVNTLPETGSWEALGNVTRVILLSAGRVSLQIRVLEPGWNLASISLEKVLPLFGANGEDFTIEAPDTINGKPSWDEPIIRDPWTPILDDAVFRDPLATDFAALASNP